MNLDQTLDAIDNLYGRPLNVISDCLRAMLVAEPGHDFIAADFANIEGRVLAWLAGEEWKVQAFRDYDAGTGDDIYKITAGEILGKPAKDVTKNERQSHGKIPELALGFAGGKGAFHAMARVYNTKFTDEEAEAIKNAWRKKHPRVVKFWRDLEDASIEAVQHPGTVTRAAMILFKRNGSFLFARLPSGRCLCYPYPRIEEKEMPWYDPEPKWVGCSDRNEAHFLYGLDVEYDERRRAAKVRVHAKRPALFYKCVDPTTKAWGDTDTYGGALSENVTQAVARDVLSASLLRLEQQGYNVAMHVHDEVVCEVPEAFGSVDEMTDIMEQVPTWAQGLPIAAEGWRGKRYRK